MVYKYQYETIEYLKDVVERLEKLTDDKMSLKIGRVKGEFLNANGTRYVEHKGDLILNINYGDDFSMITNIERIYFSNFTDDMYVRFDGNIFLKLNEFIDSIYKNKYDREEFHRNLNIELNALCKAL